MARGLVYRGGNLRRLSTHHNDHDGWRVTDLTLQNGPGEAPYGAGVVLTSVTAPSINTIPLSPPAVVPLPDPVADHLKNLEQVSPRRLPRSGLAARHDISNAEVLARRTFRHNLREVTIPGEEAPIQVLTAGRGHFKALWTRDACFASLGLIESGNDLASVRDTLKAILSFPDLDGALPVRMGEHSNRWLLIREFFGFNTPECGKLSIIKHKNARGADQIDCNALPIISACRYIEKSGDRTFFNDHRETLRRAAAWILTHKHDGLVVQEPSGDWKDMVGRTGAVTYTNSLCYEALRTLSSLEYQYGDPEEGALLKMEALSLKAEMQGRLWNREKGCFRDSDKIDTFSSDGNIFAVLFGIADEHQATQVFSHFEKLLKSGPLPFPALDGEYPDTYIPLYLKAYGLRHYHDTFVWPWLGSALAVAAVDRGRADLAETVLARIAAQVVKDGTFYEIYRPGLAPEPVSTWAYHSEPGFLWSAGVFQWALTKLRQ